MAQPWLCTAQDLVEQTFKNLFPETFVAAHPVQRHKVGPGTPTNPLSSFPQSTLHCSEDSQESLYTTMVSTAR